MPKLFIAPSILLAVLLLLISLIAPAAFAQTKPITIVADLTDAPRKLVRATLEIPVQPGPLTLMYPQWIPGDHRPSGAIDNLTGIMMKADGPNGGKDLAWRRDDVNMYAFHVQVPEGASNLELKLDFLATPGGTVSDDDTSTSENLCVLNWREVVLYPAGIPVADIPITPSLKLPAGWHAGTAQTPVAGDTTGTKFQTITVDELVDSPAIAGRYFREFPLAPEITPKHYLDVVADEPQDLNIKPEILSGYARLVRETGPLFASRHYNTYHFLLTLSEDLGFAGTEHPQSSDDRMTEKSLNDPDSAMLAADLLPHEFTHSWNGKYRRPAGLATPDFATPQKGELLWVYEGMTQYWGTVLAARSGLLTPEQYRELLADVATNLDAARPGRTWRNVEDTAVSSQILRNTSRQYANWRRGQDYYEEGLLIWLDADTTIRRLTDGKRSLNDFAVQFFGVGGNTPPKVVPYTFDDVVAALNAVAPYDWAGFLNARIHSRSPHAPLDGIEHGGYRLVYTDQMSSYGKAAEAAFKFTDASLSLGISIAQDGTINDVIIDSPAFKAGLGPASKIIAVNGLTYSADRLKQAIRDSKGSSTPIEMIVERTDVVRTVHIDYHGGEKFPNFQRINGTPDLLGDIVKPMTK